jgi:hypothetical protein
MEIRWLTAFLDLSRNAGAAEEFWLAVTRSRLSARRGEFQQFATLLPPDGDAFLRVQNVDGDGGCHLDVHVEDVRDSTAVDLGASVVEDLGDIVVFRSPGGLPFCLVPHRGEGVRPSPLTWPDGQTSLVDQLCIDIPPADFDREADFWSALTGWERRPTDTAEFDYLVRPEGMPLRLLLQRLDGPAPGVRAHLDLACDGREPEVRRHQALGATYVRETDDWVTLLDPAGLPYCITTRAPGIGTVGSGG